MHARIFDRHTNWDALSGAIPLTLTTQAELTAARQFSWMAADWRVPLSVGTRWENAGMSAIRKLVEYCGLHLEPIEDLDDILGPP